MTTVTLRSHYILVNCWLVINMYLMSRFFLITAQTREFPTILVMISTDVTTVLAISADSDMTERCQCCSHNLKGKMTCVFHKNKGSFSNEGDEGSKNLFIKRKSCLF